MIESQQHCSFFISLIWLSAYSQVANRPGGRLLIFGKFSDPPDFGQYSSCLSIFEKSVVKLHSGCLNQHCTQKGYIYGWKCKSKDKKNLYLLQLISFESFISVQL